MEHQELTPELLQEYEDMIYQTAENVNSNAKIAQDYMFTIHGPLSDTRKTFLSDFFQYPEEEETKAPAGKKIVIYPLNNKHSYMFNGLVGNPITIISKINHLVIRDCKDLVIDIQEGTISGVDILRGNNISIQTTVHNSTNAEYVNKTDLKGKVDSDSRISVRNCWDVHVNEKSVPITPFHSTLVTSDGDNLETSVLSKSAPSKITLLNW
jgi:hypothetical protein